MASAGDFCFAVEVEEHEFAFLRLDGTGVIDAGAYLDTK